MKTAALYLAVAALAFAGNSPGVSPRSAADDYPAHAGRDDVAIGAAMLGPGQVHGEFSTDLNRGYLVIEVAVYPKPGTQLDLGPGDFSLRETGSGAVLRPVAPQVVARALQRSGESGRDVPLHPSVGIGYGGGRGMYGGGVGTAVGVGAGVGGRQRAPASSPDDRKTMEMELGDKQLPERLVGQPVAGYLYFPAPKEKGRAYELEYHSPAGNLILALPAPPRK